MNTTILFLSFFCQLPPPHSALSIEFPPPIQRTEDIERLIRTGRQIAPALVWIGIPGEIHGTGIVISQKKRLIATAAHIADLASIRGKEALRVKLKGVDFDYKIIKIFYHPNTKRILHNTFIVNSSNPEDGPIAFNRTPDVAVLELSQDGPSLESECTLATSDELDNLESKPIGHIGYPANSFEVATIPAGLVSYKISVGSVLCSLDFLTENLTPKGRAQRVWLSAYLGEGASGGPCFFTNGHIMSIFSYRVEVPGRAKLSETIRVDCLRELLQYYDLHDINKIKLNNNIYNKIRILSEILTLNYNKYKVLQLNRALHLVTIASNARRDNEFSKAVKLCNDALSIEINFEKALLERGKSYIYYCCHNWNALSKSARIRYGQWAKADAEQCLRLNPNSFYAMVVLLQANNILAHEDETTVLFSDNILMAGDLLGWDNLSNKDRALVLDSKALAEHLSGDQLSAAKDYGEAIILSPMDYQLVLNRAKFWYNTNNYTMYYYDINLSNKLIKSIKNTTTDRLKPVGSSVR